MEAWSCLWLRRCGRCLEGISRGSSRSALGVRCGCRGSGPQEVSRHRRVLLHFSSTLGGRAVGGASLAPRTTAALWELSSTLGIVENQAKLVAGTKALHHILPELVVPMDREYTQLLFGWQNPRFQYAQRECFLEAY